MQYSFYKQALLQAAAIFACMGLCKITNGYFVPVIVIAGLIAALAARLKLAFFCFALTVFFVIVNSFIVPKEGVVSTLSLRFGVLGMSLLLAFRGGSRRGRSILPLIGFIPFLLAASISSFNGWSARVSYFKLMFFASFLMGVGIGFKNLDSRQDVVYYLRVLFFALAIVIVFGSLATLPFPGIAYSTSLRDVISHEGLDAANAEFSVRANTGAFGSLFSGIIYHSQDLAPVLAATVTWLICDMLFVEKRVRGLHLIVIALSLPMLYMTRSRVAFFSMASGMMLVYFYTSRKVVMSQRLRQRMGRILTGGAILLTILLAVVEVRDHTVTRWLRKTDDLAGDTRDLGDALTSSRQGKIDESMYEFHLNPLWGMGFQVDYMTPIRVAQTKGLVLSSPIEKGLLPLMVLGETGIIGSMFFLFALFYFYSCCVRKKYFIALTMSMVFFATNMGEATFFSPGATGGYLWLCCPVAGFVLDLIIQRDAFAPQALQRRMA